MPELPEVETVKRTLTEQIVGRTVTGITIIQPSVIRCPAPAGFTQSIIGKKVQGIRRRGKYLILNLSDDYTMVVHLRMTGQFTVAERETPIKKHTHVIFDLDDGRHLRFWDQRRFGCIWLVTKGALDRIGGLMTLGPEPLEEGFTIDILTKAVSNRQARIKGILLDQHVVAGIGNIYADEILYNSAIHPERTGASLTMDEIARLFTSIKYILAQGVEHRGTSFSDYVDGRGQKGSHQNYLKVYQQVGKICERCQAKIERIKQGGRSAYHCPGCQK